MLSYETHVWAPNYRAKLTKTLELPLVGEKYIYSRHSVGAYIIDHFRRPQSSIQAPTECRLSRHFQYIVSAIHLVTAKLA